MSGTTGRGSWRLDVCGRFVSTLSAELLALNYVIRLPAMVIESRYNVAPGQTVLTVLESPAGRELTPCPTELLSAHPVSTLVNTPRNTGSECLTRV